MKSFTTLALAYAGLINSTPLFPPGLSQADIERHQANKRQILGTITWILGKGGKVADPPGAAPKRVDMPSDSKIPGAKRVKMRYGPYSVPNMMRKSINGEAGALWNYPDVDIPKPCAECTIVGQWAGLEYPDGKNANIDNGMWLHHMVQLTLGRDRSDPTCYGSLSLPHMDVGASPYNGERFFSSGNERTKIQMDKLGVDAKVGYHLKPSDRFAFIVDLMNMNMQDKTVYLTMTYDIIDGPLLTGWRDLRVIWFDANQCGTSEIHAPQQNGKFTIASKPWKPNFEGEIMGVGTHVHDGGASVDVISPSSACRSEAKYGETPEFISAPMMGAGANYMEKHISSMSTCYRADMGVTNLSKDQTWQIKCNYDYDTFPGDRDEQGEQEGIMCIALMYVAVPAGGVQLTSPSEGAFRGAQELFTAALDGLKGFVSSVGDAFSSIMGVSARSALPAMQRRGASRQSRMGTVRAVSWDGDMDSPARAGLIEFGEDGLLQYDSVPWFEG